jgi:hypothetical protein
MIDIITKDEFGTSAPLAQNRLLWAVGFFSRMMNKRTNKKLKQKRSVGLLIELIVI